MFDKPTEFRQLNEGWNADPNDPDPLARSDGCDVILSFHPNYFVYPEYEGVERIEIRFEQCSRYRFTSINDEGWYRGQCRFSKLAPRWGEFYEIQGNLHRKWIERGWVSTGVKAESTRHFLFYFRSNTFECDARNWIKE